MLEERGPLEVALLRERIERLDRVLVALIASRFQAVEDMFRAKDRSARSRFDPLQERRVRDRARVWASEFGVPPDAADRVLRAVLREGKRVATERIDLGRSDRREATFWFPSAAPVRPAREVVSSDARAGES